MGKVRMRNPEDGKVYEFDSSQGREALSRGWTQELSGVQQLGKGVSDMLPPLATTAGAIAGIPGGPGGMAVGGLYGAGIGATGREMGYDAAGVMKDDSPLAKAARYSYEGAQGLLSGMAQGVGSPARPAIAEGAMKGAIGEAQIGTPQTMLAEGVQVSGNGLARVQKLIDAEKARKAAAMARIGQSWRVSYKTFAGALQRAINQAEQSDVVSPHAKTALQKALAYLEESIGPKVTGGQVTTMVDQYGNPLVTPRVVTPAKPLTLAQVEKMRAWAAKQVKAYRQANGFAPSGPPDPIELGYRAVEETARNLINGIRTKSGTIGDMNARIARLIRVGDDLTERLQRPPVVNPATSTLSVAGGAMPGIAYGMYAHNPALGAELGLLGAGVGQTANYLAHDPRTLSRIALAMRNPSIGRGLMTQLPVRMADAYARLAGASNPQAQPALPPELQPDYMK